MIVLQDIKLDSLEKCPYICGKKKQFEYFFAYELSKDQISMLWETGWRKFGVYFFRPRCPSCQDCLPIRVITNDFSASRNQRRVLKKNQHLDVKISPLIYRDEIFDLYAKHSENRFDQKNLCKKDFKQSFYMPSCPALQSEFYLNEKLIAVGFLDCGKNALSSVYFVYNTDYEHLSIGTFSILVEIEYAKKIGLPYYYLGYYIEECSSMSYKGKFYPHECFNWKKQKWELVLKK